MFRGKGGVAEHLCRPFHPVQLRQVRINLCCLQLFGVPVSGEVDAQTSYPVLGLRPAFRREHFQSLVMLFLFFVPGVIRIGGHVGGVLWLRERFR